MARKCLLLALVLGVLACWLPAASAQIGPGEKIDLATTLEKGLRVRVQRERQFVLRVVELVDEGTFQRELVLTIFEKARLRHQRHPFVYFKEMMVFVAKKQGVVLTD
jgi:hypothetical protein